MEDVQALTFDVFGTVVDWRGSLIREGEMLARKKSIDADWAAFADAWRGLYQPLMERVRGGQLPWTKLDELHRIGLDSILSRFGLGDLNETEIADLNRAWHRLDPWPDAVEGLTRLKRKYVLATLSNGNVGLLVNMAKRAGLPWDAVLGAEVARAYKPQPKAYKRTADFLGLPPSQCMMVAAHGGDLKAARECGFRTAFVSRPLEHGPGKPGDAGESGNWDVKARDFNDLARQLGC
jgi:2-haloacid dehalogenase